MRYRKLGKWGLKVSEIALGSWMTDVSDAKAQEIAAEGVRKSYELGVNFFDCADAYSGGGAEKFLGNVLSEYERSSYVLSSKVFFPTGKGPNDRGLSRKHIFENVDKSLKNLKTDYLDLYFCHRYDPDTPVEETMEALSDLVKMGKILYYGVSEWMPSQVMEALNVIEKKNLRPLSVIQPEYNMVDRFIEDEMMGICEKNGIGIVAFSPLAQGQLTDRYLHGIPEDSRIRTDGRFLKESTLDEHRMDQIRKLNDLAAQRGEKLADMALGWLLHHNEVTSVLIGASKPQQILDNVKAVSCAPFTEEELKLIDEISA